MRILNKIAEYPAGTLSSFDLLRAPEDSIDHKGIK
jgi:hypothetical protein